MAKIQSTTSGLSQENMSAELVRLKNALKLEKEKNKLLEEKVRLHEGLSNNDLKEFSNAGLKVSTTAQDNIFQSLIQNSADIITLVDQKGVITYNSSSVREVLGYAESELVGRNMFEFVHPHDVEDMKFEFNNTLGQTGMGRKIECQFLHKNGEYIYLEAQGNNQLNNPQIRRFVINSRDITQRKSSELELHKSEEQKQMILSSITEAFIAMDNNWNLLYINNRANVLFNRAKKDLIGANFWEVFGDFSKNKKNYLSARSSNKQKHFDCFYEPLQKWLKVKVYPSRNGVSVFFTDITEEKIQRTILEVEQYALIENNKRNKRLSVIIDEAIIKMESILPGMHCSLLLLSENGKVLKHFSSPSVSQDFIDNIDGIEIADNYGTCPTAAFRNEIVITQNIQNDPLWTGFHELAQKEGLVSCWSFPILSSSDEVVATFAVYFEKETKPSKTDLSFFYKIRVVLANLLEGRKKEDEINKLSLIAKNMNKAVFITGLDQRITWVNSAFTKVTGYSSEEARGQKPIKLLQGKNSDPETMVYLKKQIIDGLPFYTNTVFHKKNGEMYWSRISGQAMHDEAGNINQYFAVQEDTTARKLAKIELQDSEKRYRALFHSNSQPMFIYDKLTLRFLEVNEAAINVYGYSADEFNGMTIPDLLEDKLRLSYNPKKDKINDRNSLFHSSSIKTDLSIHKTKRGNKINVEIIRNEMTISGKKSILTIINDVTKKLSMEKKLIQSNERFTLASKAVNEAIWDFNLLTGKLHWAVGMTHLFGYQSVKDFPTKSTWKKFVHPDDYQEVKAKFDDALENSFVDYWNGEYRFLKSDGTFAYILDRAFIVRDDKGKPVRVIGAMQDITKQKQFEIQKYTLISETQEHERKRFSMELHDGLAQHLVALNLYLSQIEEDEMVDPLTLKNCFDILKVSMNQTRALCYSLTPPELEHGFLLALQAMFERLKSVKAFAMVLEIEDGISDQDFGEADKYNLYRIIQEFVNNSIKHSKGDLIACKVVKQKNLLHIFLKDNGVGFDMSKESNSLGLKNIAQRAYLANITYVFDSKLGVGTTLQIELVIKEKSYSIS